MRWPPFFILAYIVLGMQIGLSGIVNVHGAKPDFVLMAAIFIALNASRDPALLGCFILGLLRDLLVRDQHAGNRSPRSRPHAFVPRTGRRAHFGRNSLHPRLDLPLAPSSVRPAAPGSRPADHQRYLHRTADSRPAPAPATNEKVLRIPIEPSRVRRTTRLTSQHKRITAGSEDHV